MSYTGSAPVNQHKEEDALRGRAVKNQKVTPNFVAFIC